MRQKIVVVSVLVLTLCLTNVHSFESGFHLYLNADFGGALTLPSISASGLKDLNPYAYAMQGMMSNLLIGAELEVGYIFRSHDFFNLSENNIFSGLGVFFLLGFSQHSTGQKISASVDDTGENLFDIFMTVDFLPVVNFGAAVKPYFFNNRLALSLGVYGRMIADMVPEYFVYSTLPQVIATEIGSIVVTEDMMKRMNPVMFSFKGGLEYNIPVIKTLEVLLGFYVRYNMFLPKYLTMPESLKKIAEANNPDFDINKAQPDYWLNSLDFGVRFGIGFKL